MKLFHRRPKKVESEKDIEDKIDGLLKSLCGDDNALFEAMSDFLLLDPRQKEEQIGSTSRLSEEGVRAMNNGNELGARISFEIAARLGFYHQDKLSVEKNLKLAEQLSERQKETARMGVHLTLLSNLDRAFEIAAQYYKHVYADTAREDKKDEGVVLEVATVLVRK